MDRDVVRLVVAAVAGAVVLAVVGAPQSPEMVALTGPDTPSLIGSQVLVGVGGAVATAVAVLFAQYWWRLLVIGSAGVVLGILLHDPGPGLWSVRVAGPDGETAAAELPTPVAVAVLLMAAAGVLLVGLLGVAQVLFRDSGFGAAVAGFAAVAGYFGVSVIGRLVTAPHGVRVVVVVVAAVVAAVAGLRGPVGEEPTGRIRLVAAGSVLFSVLPTVVVAVTGEMAFGTVAGGVAGLVVLAAAIVASRSAGNVGALAIGAVGLVLAAPVLTLLLVRDAVAGAVWYAWPVAGLGVLLGAALANRPWSRVAVVAAAALATLLLALEIADTNRPLGEVVVWAYLLLVMASVAATSGAAAVWFGRHNGMPAAGALGTVAAVGVFASLNFVRVGADGRADVAKLVGPTGYVVAAVTLFVAAVLLVVLGRVRSTRTG